MDNKLIAYNSTKNLRLVKKGNRYMYYSYDVCIIDIDIENGKIWIDLQYYSSTTTRHMGFALAHFNYHKFGIFMGWYNYITKTFDSYVNKSQWEQVIGEIVHILSTNLMTIEMNRIY